MWVCLAYSDTEFDIKKVSDWSLMTKSTRKKNICFKLRCLTYLMHNSFKMIVLSIFD